MTPNIVFKRLCAGVVDPCVALCFYSIGTQSKNRIIAIIERHKRIEIPAALIDPVVVLVRLQGLPGHLLITAEAADDFQFLLTAKVVANVVVVDRGLALMIFAFDEQGNGYWCARTRPEDLASFFSRQFPTGALVAPKIEHIHIRKLVLQGLAKAIHRVAV